MLESKSGIRVCLIGLGRIASTLEKDPLRNHPCTHAGTLFSPWGKREFSVVACYDKNQEKVEQFHKDWKLKKQLVTDWESILNQDFELCVVATPSETHFQLARQLMESGKKAILLEKPMASNWKEASKLAKIAEKKDTKIWINHERRYHPAYRRVAKGLMEVEWGSLRSIRASVLTSKMNPGRAFQGSIGPLLHDGTHAIDLILWYAGSVKEVQSIQSKSHPDLEVADTTTAMMQHESGVVTFLEVGGRRNYFQFELDLQTENARIILSNDGFQLFRSARSGLYTGFNSLTSSRFPEKNNRKGKAFLNLYSEIRESLNLNSPGGNLQESLEVMRTIRQIQNSSKIQMIGKVG